jgi:type III restriction enzyme
MLKEGWDVTNLYTIVPLRAANARTLIEQSIGRGLRLPYGTRTGVSVVDRLSIVAHDRFQEIIDDANRPDSTIRLAQVVLDPAADLQKTRTVVVQSTLAGRLAPIAPTIPTAPEFTPPPPLFASEGEWAVARATYEVIWDCEGLPASSYLLRPEVQRNIAEYVAARVTPSQQALPGIETPDIAAVIKTVTALVVQGTIDIPRVLVVAKGEVTAGFHPFTLDCSAIRDQPVERDLLIEHLRTRERETLRFGVGVQPEQRLEDDVVGALIEFDDVSYDEHADLLYHLAGQLVTHLRSYLSEDDARNVLIYHRKRLAAFIHAQMQAHQWESATDYEVKVSKGFTRLKPSAYTVRDGEPVHDFRGTVDDKSRIAQMVFGGFERCLYPLQKFQSDSERKLALILDRETLKWFKPPQGQFPIFYQSGADRPEYVPDFVAETEGCIYLLESKARNEMTGADVLAKKAAAIQWCVHATDHALKNGGKPWTYALIPHDAIAENMTLGGLVSQFGG